MSCKYYHWDHGYACVKLGKNVDEDTYYYYCRDYDYGDCDIYKGTGTQGWKGRNSGSGDSGSSGGSGCFLTSACVHAMNLPDDCHELSTLRRYRDTYLRNCEGGMCDIHEYYAIAPRIVEKIDESEDAPGVWKKLYDELVVPCVRLIEAGENEGARRLYKTYTLGLKLRYLAAD